MKEKRKGISLIVLVITIIVMIILAGAIILSLNNSGIIGKASEAVDKTNEAQVKSMVQTYWMEAYAMYRDDFDRIKTYVQDKIEENNWDELDYVINIKEDGVTVVKGWKQEELTVRKGDKVLEIGDKFAYDETPDDDTTIEVTKDVEWKVLGASDDGELLIMSTSDVEVKRLGQDLSSDIRYGSQAWLNGVSELNEICKQYEYGKNATGARSIKGEDVDKITGYDKTTYYKGKINEYDNEVTYSYAGEGKIKYYSSNTKKEEIVDCSTFYYLDKANELVKADLENGNGVIATFKSDYYAYDLSEIKTIKVNDPAYIMLFGENDNARYWLADQWTVTSEGQAAFGINTIVDGTIGAPALWTTLQGGLQLKMALEQ